jgi:phosphoribosylanthranilate isomerase
VQLHGEEEPALAAQLRAEGLHTIKAFRVRDASSLAGLTRYRVDAVLLDTWRAGKPGGTGETFDWELARQAQVTRPVILSGGLGPGNVREAVRTVRPAGVDTSSGIETAPGVKDANLVRDFIERARTASEEPEQEQTL